MYKHHDKNKLPTKVTEKEKHNLNNPLSVKENELIAQTLQFQKLQI
jgi:hypothetical protein